MFGRLSEAKRARAVDLMNEMVHDIAKTLVAWSTEKEFFQTPTKPYIDELYIVSSVAIYLPYTVWRKGRQDAHEDVLLSLCNVYSEVYRKYGGEGSLWPMKGHAHSEGDLLVSIGNVIDERFKEYTIAGSDQSAGIIAEMKKSQHESDLLFREVKARMNAASPFDHLVIRRLFDVDPNDQNVRKEYNGFAGQTKQFLEKRAHVFVQYLNRL